MGDRDAVSGFKGVAGHAAVGDSNLRFDVKTAVLEVEPVAGFSADPVGIGIIRTVHAVQCKVVFETVVLGHQVNIRAARKKPGALDRHAVALVVYGPNGRRKTAC